MGAALPLYGNGSQTLHTVLPLGARQLRRFFTARQFDVVHIHAPYNPSFFMLAPFVLPAGTIGVGTYHSVFTPGRVRDLVHAPTRASLSRLDGHIVVSDVCIEPLDHYFPEFTWRVIPNGIDEDHFAPGAEPIAALRESGDPVILFLGRFDPRNGLGIMLDAFNEVWRARDGPRAPVRRGRRPAAPLLPEQAGARGGGGSALGRAHRLEPSALLRLGRRLLHALPAGELRHGAARGHELRPSGRREPDLRVRAAAARAAARGCWSRRRTIRRVRRPRSCTCWTRPPSWAAWAPKDVSPPPPATPGASVAAELEAYYLELRGELPVEASSWAPPQRSTRLRHASDRMPGVARLALHLAASARLDGRDLRVLVAARRRAPAGERGRCCASSGTWPGTSS